MDDRRDLDELVFVYGNLRKHGSEAYRMDGAVRVSAGEVAGKLVVKGGRPAMVAGEAGGYVVGELYRTSWSHLSDLDRGGESSDGGRYRRVKVPVYQEASPRFLGEAWAWQLDESLEGAVVVKSGDWLEVARPRPRPIFTLVAVGCLVGCFALFVIGPPPRHPLHPRPVHFMALFNLSLAASPVVGLIAAWWGLRRRERFPAMGMIALGLLVPLVALSLMATAEAIAERLGF